MEKEQIIFENNNLHCHSREVEFTEGRFTRGKHFHEEAELVYVQSGAILCEVESKRLTLTAGSIAVIGARIIHRLSYLAEPSIVKYIQINIDNFLNELFPDLSLFSYFLEKTEKKYEIFPASSNIGDAFFIVYNELQSKKRHYEIAVKGAVYQLITYAGREGMLIGDMSFLAKNEYKKILPALIYASNNFSQKISLDGVCYKLSADKYHFCKKFKKILGITFFEYIAYLRLKKARELLMNTDKTITEISFECGFMSVSYFNRVFFARYSCSPTAYRQMIKKLSNE